VGMSDEIIGEWVCDVIIKKKGWWSGFVGGRGWGRANLWSEEAKSIR